MFFHVRVACSSKTRRGLAHRTSQVRSVDPQQFANTLSIHSLLRLWQLFVVVLPACQSNSLNAVLLQSSSRFSTYS